MVKEITLDMAKNIESGVKKSFPNVKLVIDRFHVVKLVLEALQHIRIQFRWNEIDKENIAIAVAKKNGNKYTPKIYENGDSPKQLLARSRYILFKKASKWTPNQQQRANILFKEYPDLEKAYKLVMKFRNIYELEDKIVAEKEFNLWITNVFTNGQKEFYTAANSVKGNLDNILNFFINRNTNANAESFNAKIKLFRANLRGVSDSTFFLFRLKKLFA